jgi:hypothetical protein
MRKCGLYAAIIHFRVFSVLFLFLTEAQSSQSNISLVVFSPCSLRVCER